MSRTTAFFDLFKTRFGQKRYEEMMAVWEEAHAYDTCTSIVKTGDRKDQVCGKACLTGKTYCLCHTPRPELAEKRVCGKELITGKNKGKTCLRFCAEGQDRCSIHVVSNTGKVCPFIILRGPRANEKCGKVCKNGVIKNGIVYCSRHFSKDDVNQEDTNAKEETK